ncbi:MAG: hypothetical protein OHK0039_05910 [Bacteroidia bacterium]
MRIISLTLLLLCLAMPRGIAQSDSTRQAMAANPELTPVAGPLINADQLNRKPWFYSIDEAMRAPEQVYKLSLEGKNLKRFPFDIARFPNLQVLNLSNNKIREIPDEISSLKNLQVLNLARNRIFVLPENMRYLEHLTHLYLGYNKIVQMPAWVGGFGQLRVLDLAYNNLTLLDIDQVRARLPYCTVTH